VRSEQREREREYLESGAIEAGTGRIDEGRGWREREAFAAREMEREREWERAMAVVVEDARMRRHGCNAMRCERELQKE